MARRLSASLVSLVVVLVLFVSACAAQPAPTPTKAPPPAPTATSAAPAKTAPAAPTATAAAPPPKPEASEVDKIKVGVGPFTSHSGMFAADKLGYFKEEGLTVEFIQAGGAAAMSQVAAGKLEFAGVDFVTVLSGRSQGFDFVPVIPSQVMKREPPVSIGLLIRADSDIKTAKDLEGKRVAVLNLNNSQWLTVRAYMKKYSADPEKVRWAEVPWANMGDMLINNQVDVVYQTEPLITNILATGKAKLFTFPFHEIQPGWQLAFFSGSEKWIKDHPIATKKFYRAVSKAYDNLNKTPAEKKRLALEWTKMAPDVFDKIIPDDPWPLTVNVAMLQKSADLMLEHGLMKEKIDVSKFAYKP